MYTSFRPGKIWRDTDGKRIHAHGGSIIYINNVYYWYGENKEGITGNSTGEKCPFWHHGVRLYSSTDLYNWKDEGIIMEESDDPKNPFYPKNIMDRPHIIYNKKTKKYVMWSKTSSTDFGQCNFSICVADDIHDFTYIGYAKNAAFHAGDFDIFEKDGKAYIIYEHPHLDLICQELTDDYTDTKKEFTSHLSEECPPYVREAPAFFSYQGKDFVITSGTTGYFPNPTRAANITDINGNWINLGKVCINDKNNNSFHAQFSSVFKHPKIENLYIALGDRWIKDLPEDMPDIQEIYYKIFSNKFTQEEKDKAVELLPLLSDENTSEADYVWLPIKFDDNGNPYIEYLKDWKY